MCSEIPNISRTRQMRSSLLCMSLKFSHLRSLKVLLRRTNCLTNMTSLNPLSRWDIVHSRIGCNFYSIYSYNMADDNNNILQGQVKNMQIYTTNIPVYNIRIITLAKHCWTYVNYVATFLCHRSVYFISVVADGLAPSGCQAISNHHADSNVTMVP